MVKRTEMKRGTSTLKRTEMSRSTGLTAGAAPKRKKAPKPKVRAERTDAEQAAMDRDGPECQRCGVSLQDTSASKHHRKRRREADADAVANIVLLCGSGTTGCHGWCHAHPNKARAEGWILWSGENPAGKPCLSARGRTGVEAEPGSYTAQTVYLDDGTKVTDEMPLVPMRASGPNWPMWTAT